jgi:hypothetical protein
MQNLRVDCPYTTHCGDNDMKPLRAEFNSNEILRRAAEVRLRWTAAEKRRRAGLPPDTPRWLRDYVLGRTPPVWTKAATTGWPTR